MESGDRGMSAPAILDVKGLRLCRGPREVLHSITLQARRGELVALMGLSGEGKTTILRAIAALEPFDGGSIVVGRTELTPCRRHPGATLRALRDQVGMVFQHHCLFEHLSAVENVWLAPVYVRGHSPEEAKSRARILLEELGVAHRADALPREISGGEAQRVAIARALAMDPPLLLMDEPTASLDPARRQDLGETLGALTAAGRTLVITSHDDDFVRDFATRVIVLSGGEVVEEGPPNRVIAQPQHPATERLLMTERARRRPAV
jgi:ABC-type polar amino acid transport system ATPase subunit